MDGITIYTTANDFAERMAQAPRVFGEEIAAEVNRTVLAIDGDAKRGAPADRGTLRRSITPSLAKPITGSSGFVGSVGTNLDYARSVHDGRRPGSMPPVAPLVAWARRRGIPNPESVGYAIARSIARRGIKAVPFLRRAVERHAPALPRNVQAGVARGVTRLFGGG